MPDVRVTETARYRTGERFQLITRQIQYRNNFLIDSFFDKSAHVSIVHRLAYRVQPGLEGYRYQRRVRTVQNGDFTLFVGTDVIHDQYVERELIKTQFAGKGVRALNHKQIEVFGGIQEPVLITQFSLQGGHFVTRVTRYNAVNQGRAETVGIVQPFSKGRRQRPLLRVAQHQFPQRIPIVVNQFTRNDDPAFVWRTVKMTETLEEQSRQFRRVADGRRIFKGVARVITDPGFRGIREHKAHLRVMSQPEERIVFIINVDFAVNGTDKTCIAHRVALLVQAANDRGIQTILRIQRRRKITLNGTNDHHTGVEIGMFV